MVPPEWVEAIGNLPLPDSARSVAAGAALVTSLGGLLVRFRDRAHLLLLVVAPALAAMTAGARGWQGLESLGTLSATCLGISLLTYALLRWRRVGFGVVTALAVGGASPVITMGLLGPGLLEESQRWWLVMLPLGIVVSGVLAAVLYAGRRAVAAEAAPSAEAGGGPGDREAGLVLEMLGQGKVSAREAADLLEAVREKVPADRLPLSGGVVTSLLGGLEIAIGWTMPWRYVPVEGGLAYESGFHVRPHGWLVLLLGVLPAVLACIPALDHHLRQSMLRLFLALIGMVLTLSLISLIAAGGVPEVGLLLCLLGFGTQVLGALKESGIVQAVAARSGRGGQGGR